ncbi:sodium-dependent transporter [Aeromicrobium camelliae]|uniref:Sodium-dependent transporter n=1 Tax=Aeromicrobium camelliae TaxID=1538144 RepID=A0A3N6YWZ8_9ACTN|nr:sodium-dependent transporter [Aeromicrobium camelliae]RQN02261.1 sodium-dependent transporter [Aeromicrobium camelliae]
MAEVKREAWGGRTAFIVAAVSSAIGLGNIWRFPGVAYENGGGAFLIPYLVAFLTAGIPILYLDYALGHRYKAAPPLTFRRADRRLEPLGWWQVAVCYVIAIYYAVVIAWALAYAVYSLTLAWGDDANAFFFGDYLSAADPGFSLDFVATVFWPLLIVWVLTVVVMSLGIRRGLERVNRVTLPLLVVLFVAIVVYAITLDGAIDGVNAFFTPSWSALADPAVWIAAYGHIFFSFSIAFGIMLTYSSYLGRKADLTGSGTVVAFGNCSFEILAGIGVFATLGFLAAQQSTTVAELEGITGVGLAFVTFPTLLSQMPGGAVIGVFFFLSLVFAGFTSLLSILQVVSGAVQDKTGWSPAKAGIVVGVAATVPSILLFSTTTGINTLDVVDAFINNIGVVTSAVLTLVLVAWVARAVPRLADHLNAGATLRVGPLWKAMVMYVSPLILAAVLVTGAWTYITDGYGGFPQWFLLVAGWGLIGVVAIVSVALSFQRYRRPDAENFAPDDVEALARDVSAARERVRTEGNGRSS